MQKKEKTDDAEERENRRWRRKRERKVKMGFGKTKDGRWRKERRWLRAGKECAMEKRGGRLIRDEKYKRHNNMFWRSATSNIQILLFVPARRSNMSGMAVPPPTAPATHQGLTGGGRQQLPPSVVNSFRVAAAAERLASHVLQPARHPDSLEFFNLCLSLARGIDYAIANNEVPAKVQELPSLFKQICQRKNDLFLQAAIMVLMISVKNACKIGWFSAKESQELLVLANEIGRGFCIPGNIDFEPRNLVKTVSTIKSRFYPLLMMGHILASLEVKESGYGTYMVDFHIPKNMVHSPQEKIHLFVAQTDNIETSACLISPQQVNFLINGRGVVRRTNLLMDPGPQMPTNVTAMLKYGSNLLQAVGQFNGCCIIVVAFMSMLSSLDSPVLQDYVQPCDVVQDKDSDIIEGPSRISLNCPISYTRIRTPVKGHSCKHLQCFDFINFIDINSRRPSWRCPHCNQHVCYTDIRVDKNIAKVLKEVGDNVADVIISADGSWKAVLDNDDDVDNSHVKSSSPEEDGTEPKESNGISKSSTVVLDLTKDDDMMDAAHADEVERKPLISVSQNQSASSIPVRPLELNDIGGPSQNFSTHMDDNFWSNLLSTLPSTSSGAGSDPLTSSNPITSPVLNATLSPALNNDALDPSYTNLMTSMMQRQSAPRHLQQPQSVNLTNHEFETLPLQYYEQVNRTPVAVQALPARPQPPSPHQRVGHNLISSTPNGSSIASQPPLSASNGYRDVLSDTERLQRFSRPLMNTVPRPNMGPPNLQHPMAGQNAAGIPVSSASTGFSTGNQNLLQQQAPDLRLPQPRSQSPRFVQSSSPFSPTLTSSTAVNANGQHGRATVAAQGATRPATQISRQSSLVPPLVQTSTAGVPPPVRVENLVDLTSEQNWRPTGRMRGSLTGRAYSDAFRQFIIQPNLTSPTSAARVPPHLQMHSGNRGAPNPQSHNNLNTDPANPS